ncbi:hypothetical protein [Methylobacterium sp. WSM2598]|uniref:hypothetical protein n=1 Tax=Methylobacterium sp. WSM2598 TaxID=398261 RepID=UPI00037FE9D3|nr:hypothetical protein [Methylobacterium sp. WSM2598]
MFAREIYRRGEITLKERNRIIVGAWQDPDLTEDEIETARARLVELFSETMLWMNVKTRNLFLEN